MPSTSHSSASMRPACWCSQKEKCRNGHVWVLVAPEKHVPYGYSEQHNGAAVDELLKGYQATSWLSAHSVYDHLSAESDVIEVACRAHCRRYFFKSLASEPERAKAASSHISVLFRVERTIADSPRGKKEQVRRAKSRPWVERFVASSATIGSPSPTTSVTQPEALGPRSSQLALRRQRRRRAREYCLRVSARQRPAARHRAARPSPRPAVPPPQLAPAPHPGTRPPIGGRPSGSPKLSRRWLPTSPSGPSCAAVLNRPSRVRTYRGRRRLSGTGPTERIREVWRRRGKRSTAELFARRAHMVANRTKTGTIPSRVSSTPTLSACAPT
jgi:hypothetical protein